ncbi:hypothetical protein W97_01077 [Coniosporium apollinis CBS 100218]|uniref:BZIP domain-containing protein n=1 Tax=Coniosporium apollinis (strain CBS 100218) TaxID=1168221 RepID=R7YJ76_CONA1|nr:uncharacterized protein W97_01077 [Coniosporium apollinis CBS 100218]EON61859.1 hypothetical protein W97_01077 [Coniosporium apollinis CBS 100218]
MAFACQPDLRRPSSTLSIDTKSVSLFGDSDTLPDFALDHTAIMSPTLTQRRDSFSTAANGFWSPDAQPWEEFPVSFMDRTASASTNPFLQQDNNPFTRLNSTQAAAYGQQPAAWPLHDADSGSCTPTTAKTDYAFHPDFDTGPASAFGMPVGSNAAFSGLPHSNVRPSSVFPSAAAGTPAMPQSPHSHKEWMAMAASEVESRPMPKRMRPNTPPRSFSPGFLRRDGIRKKNARFEIPAERSLLNIDHLIAQSQDEDEIKELKQQKRLLRNRQAALDSRQRKKKHTEELEEEKKAWTTRLGELEDELVHMRMQHDAALQEKDHWHREFLHAEQVNNGLQYEREEMVRTHTLETGELRKKVSVLTEKLEASSSTAMSHQPSQSSFTDFAADMDNLTMGGNDWDNYIFVNDFCIDPEQTQNQQLPQPAQQQPQQSLVVRQSKKDEDKPVASGLLLMLLLCGAFVASRSSGSSVPAIPRIPDDVRAASTQVLDSIFKDAGVAPSSTSPSAPVHSSNVIVNHVEGWPRTTLSGAEFASLSNLDNLHHHLVAPTKDQEAEQLFSITPAQYNSLTSTDFARRVYSVHSDDDHSAALSPASQSPSHRRNLAETLAAMREESKGETAAEVYTRSLLWDTIPSEVVREFKRMVEGSGADVDTPLSNVDSGLKCE